MSSSVLKWYGFLTIALYILVGSKQILNIKSPRLSFPSTSQKLLIHGVDLSEYDMGDMESIEYPQKYWVTL